MADNRKNPYPAFNFKVSIPGVANIGFMECTGLDSENSPMEYRDQEVPPGTDGNFVRKLPGLERYPNIVLKRGITTDKQLWSWRKQVRAGESYDTIAKDITITLQDEKHTDVLKWKVQKAWPMKLSGPTLNAKSNELAFEQLELCCERVEVVD